MQTLRNEPVEIEVKGMHEISENEAELISGARINLDNVLNTHWLQKAQEEWFDRYKERYPSVNLWE